MGQSFELTIPYRLGALTDSIDGFHRLHDQRYSYSIPDREVQIVAIRLDAVIPTPSPIPPAVAEKPGDPDPVGQARTRFGDRFLDTNVFERDRLGAGQEFSGPAIVLQDDCTTVVLPDWMASVDRHGTLVITRKS